MRKLLIIFGAFLFLISSCTLFKRTPSNIDSNYQFKIAFGSCGHQNKPQPILKKVVAENPDLFIYLGDNIYGDTRNMDTLQKKYELLGDKPEFQNLKRQVPLLAVWDDHDYGENDAGKYYPMKEQSKKIFLNFWNEPKNSDRYRHKGIYHSLTYNFKNKVIQIILLDTRTFRSNLTLNDKKSGYKNDYIPTMGYDSTFLGEVQWNWLDKTLTEKADLRIIASSTQFSHEYNGWESWNNVPEERNKLLSIIKKNEANGIVFISGDVHWGEISQLNTAGLYPIYDITSSGLTQKWPNTEPNKNRIGKVVRNNNFGMIVLNLKKEPSLTFYIKNRKGRTKVKHKIQLKHLRVE
jgi:alkaline phosphatase D